MSNSATSHRVNHGPRTDVVVWGLAGVVMGMISGYAFGATLGGIWVTEFSIGRLDGAEATGALGALVGGVTLGVLSFWLAVRQQAVALAWGFVGLIAGLIVGTIVGATIAGNWTTGLDIGSLHGAEAGGMLAGVSGGIVIGVLSGLLSLRHRSRK